MSRRSDFDQRNVYARRDLQGRMTIAVARAGLAAAGGRLRGR